MAPVLKKEHRKPARRESEPELTWEIARLFPAQGDWSEDEYFALDNDHFVEYSDGYLEFLPMPTIFHQLILQFLYESLKSHVSVKKLGIVVVTGYKVRLRARKYREPDILFIKEAHRSASKSSIARRPTLSLKWSARKIDRTTSRKSGSSTPGRHSEYWIIDPKKS